MIGVLQWPGCPPALCVFFVLWLSWWDQCHCDIWSQPWSPTSHRHLSPFYAKLETGSGSPQSTGGCIFVCICGYACVCACVYRGQVTTWVSLLKSHLFTLFFETETLIGLGYTERAGLAHQQTVGTQLSPPTQCWGHRCMPGRPFAHTGAWK